MAKRYKKEEHSKANILFKILALVFVIITLVFSISVLKLNMLPVTYISVFIVLEIVITFGLGYGLGKKHKTYKTNILFLIFTILISIVYIYGSVYIYATSDFIDNTFNIGNKETEDYYVIVNKNSKYQDTDDIKGKDVYLFQIEDEIQNSIIKQTNVNIKQEKSLYELGDSVCKKEDKIIFVSLSQYNILKDEITDFESSIKIIYQKEYEKAQDVNDEITKDSEYSINNGKFNILISGIDTSGKISNVARSDANIVVTVNTNTQEILITSIPRDYYVTLHSKNAKDKLTHSGIYGIKETVLTVEDLLDIDINYYVRVNFSTVEKLVDVLDGIKVESDFAFTSFDGNKFVKGTNQLNGKQALSFCRERHAFTAGDNQRIINQQKVIEAVMKKVLTSKTILTKYTTLLNSLEGSFQTNIDETEISNIVKKQLSNLSSWSITKNALTGTGAKKETYSMGNVQLYVTMPNEKSIENAKAQINKIIK